MAQESSPKVAVGTKKDARVEGRRVKLAIQQQARGGRELTRIEKVAIGQVNDAINVCRIVSERIKEGKNVPPGIMQACAMLSQAIWTIDQTGG